jgi:hypothetical protein
VEFNQLGLVLILMGLVLIIAGIVLYFSLSVPFLGRLPGDIVIRRDGFTLYIPIATSIVISIFATLVLYLVSRMK